ncbi:MAG TPA: sulfotransferase, partial [Alphaproteobacteria bacterium]|nr:sulfotransferase [Alphaproteobacteria bacterium]
MSALPGNAAALFAQARTALAQGDLAAAEQLCQRLTTDFPRMGQPWGLLAEAAIMRGNPGRAVGYAEKAVALDGDDPIAHVMLGKCLVILGRLGEAYEAAEKGAALAGGNFAALDSLGGLFGMLGDHERGAALLRQVADAGQTNPQLLYNLAAAERMAGRLEEAELHATQAIVRDPHYYPAYFLRADLREQTAEQNHIAEMEALLSRGVRHPQGEVVLRFALGKEYEDIGDYGRAFQHIAAGASLYRKSTGYRVHGDIGIVDRTIATYSRARIEAAPKGFDGDDPIFIVGLPRSGTTLVERIVGAHSQVSSAGELGVFPTEFQRLGDADPAVLGRTYSKAARQYRGVSAGRFIDKLPQNYIHCGAIHMALPRARIIALRRDPMDSCFALFKTLFANTYLFTYRLEDLADYYAAFDRLMAHWRAVLPPESFMEVAYEDIVADLGGQSRRILSFLDLPWEDQVLKFHESSNPSTTASAVQVRRPLYNSSVGKWRH